MANDEDAFVRHLILLLSVYELGSKSAPVPVWNGPRTWQSDAIIRAIVGLGRRLWGAEDQVRRCRAEHTEKKPAVSLPPAAGRGDGVDSYFPRVGDSVNELYVVEHDAKPATSKPPPPSTATTTATTSTARAKPALSLGSLPEQPLARDCPGCGRPLLLGLDTDCEPVIHSNDSSPMIVPSMGPLAHAAFESGMSAVEELKLLKAQVQDVARVCNAVARGDLSQKITVPVQGLVMVQLKNVINTMVDKLKLFAREVTRVSQEVGTDGKLGGQAHVVDVEGTWRQLTGVVNKLAANLTSQVRSIAKVTKAVALGDLSKQIEVDARGEILDLKNTVNGMVIRCVSLLPPPSLLFSSSSPLPSTHSLRALAAEVTRVTLQVGSQGMLGGQADVPDVEGVWFELVRNVCPGSLQSSRVLIFPLLGQPHVFKSHRSSPLYCRRHHCRRPRRFDPENRNTSRG